MKIAVLADIHANLHAFDAVLADARQRGAEGFICLGDTVGYGPHPQACVDRLRELKVPAVKGNHDAWAARRMDLARVDATPSTIPGIDLARRQLTDDAKRWLRSLPLLLETGAYTATHASFVEPGAWNYINSPDTALASFAQLHTRVGFFGHTHQSGLWQESDLHWIEPAPGYPFVLAPGTRYLINPGSVGCPQVPASEAALRAQYVLFDSGNQCVTFIRVTYDVQAYATAKEKAGRGVDLTEIGLPSPDSGPGPGCQP